MFDREHEVVAALARQHRRLWPAASQRAVRAERGYGRGVPDLVILDFDPAAVARRNAGGLPPVGSPAEAVVLSAIVGASGPSVADLQVPGMTDRHARAIARRLVASGHVIQDVDGLRAHGSIQPLLRRIIAIEAKLDDWRGGIVQASRYRAFADRVYVCLPEGPALRLAKHPEVCRGAGVGVIATGHTSRIVVAAMDRRPSHRGIRTWAEEVEFGYLSGTERRLVGPFPARFPLPSADALVRGV